jgi:DNA-binding PadR family transcriptional regulator
MTAIEMTSGDVLRVEEGSLYPALHRMEEAGWVGARIHASAPRRES